MPKHAKVRKIDQPNLNVDSEFKNEKITPVIKCLTSPNEDERLSSLTALSSVIDDNLMRKLFMREKLLHILLSNTLSDNNLEIQTLGLSLMRSIVQLEGRDSAVFLSRRHIELPLNLLAKRCTQYFQANRQQGHDTEGQQTEEHKDNLFKLHSLMTESLCGLVSAIVFEEPKAAYTFNDVFKFAYTLFSEPLNGLPSACLDEAMTMLFLVSEENINLLHQLSKAGFFSKTLPLVRTWIQKVYVTGMMISEVPLLDDDLDKDELLTSYLETLRTFLLEIPASEGVSIHAILDLCVQFSHTDNPFLLESFSSMVGGLLVDLLKNPDYEFVCLQSLNNLGWGFNSNGIQWMDSEAATKFAQLVHNTDGGGGGDGFHFTENPEIYEVAIGFIGSIAEQNVHILEEPVFLKMVSKSKDFVSELYSNEDSEWIALSRSLVVALGSKPQIVAQLGLVTDLRQFITNLLEFSNDVDAVIDALEATYNLFGDNKFSYNQTEFIDSKFGEKLVELQPQLRKILKSPPRDQSELRKISQETLKNLDNFIIYKKQIGE